MAEGAWVHTPSAVRGRRGGGRVRAWTPHGCGRSTTACPSCRAGRRRRADAPRAALRLPDGCGRYVLAVGTVEPRKDYPLLVRAFDAGGRRPSRRGPGRRGRRRLGCRARSPRRGGVAGRGRGSCARATSTTPRSPASCAGAAVLAYPSRYEGFGFPPLQAMAAGVPVVATAAGAVPEVVGDGAWLVDPGDGDALAGRLVHALDGGAEVEALVARGRAGAPVHLGAPVPRAWPASTGTPGAGARPVSRLRVLLLAEQLRRSAAGGIGTYVLGLLQGLDALAAEDPAERPRAGPDRQPPAPGPARPAGRAGPRAAHVGPARPAADPGLGPRTASGPRPGSTSSTPSRWPPWSRADPAGGDRARPAVAADPRGLPGPRAALARSGAGAGAAAGRPVHRARRRRGRRPGGRRRPRGRDHRDPDGLGPPAPARRRRRRRPPGPARRGRARSCCAWAPWSRARTCSGWSRRTGRSADPARAVAAGDGGSVGLGGAGGAGDRACVHAGSVSAEELAGLYARPGSWPTSPSSRGSACPRWRRCRWAPRWWPARCRARGAPPSRSIPTTPASIAAGLLGWRPTRRPGTSWCAGLGPGRPSCPGRRSPVGTVTCGSRRARASGRPAGRRP